MDHVADLKELTDSLVTLFEMKNRGKGGDSQGYQDAWLKELDARAHVARIARKVARLRHLMWGTRADPGAYWETPVDVLASQFRDIALQALLGLLQMRAERGKEKPLEEVERKDA